ncbi:MAG TPA: NUDIX hydrolase [Methanomassiliicoccales archaeon]|jgi:8-oxo-dGTP diphosphatase|nr:NUDIX hydrolase [Methanomassiliicoccales archaeon]
MAEHRNPKLTVDGIIVIEGKIVLVRRRNPPFQGELALPGGFVEYGETVEEAVAREVEEETGLAAAVERLLGVYSDPGRDPRGHTVSVVFVMGKQRGSVRAGSDAAGVEMVDLDSLPKLAFDHSRIVEDYVRSEASMRSNHGKRLN